jgi:hypothetical protein
VEANDVADTLALDGLSPAPGEVGFFLVVARNGCGRSTVGVRECGGEGAY